MAEKRMVRQDVEKSQETVYTWDQVAQHRQKDDLWIVVNNRVYDVTHFLDSVCGRHILLRYGGGRMPMHFSYDRDRLSEYRIGLIHEEESKICYETIQICVQQYWDDFKRRYLSYICVSFVFIAAL